MAIEGLDYIIIVGDDMKLRIAQKNGYENINDYNWLSDERFGSEEEAEAYAVRMLPNLPAPYAIETPHLYARRCQGKNWVV